MTEEELKQRVLEAHKDKAFNFRGGEVYEVKHYYQRVFNDSFDHLCNDCFGRAVARLANYFKDSNIQQ